MRKVSFLLLFLLSACATKPPDSIIPPQTQIIELEPSTLELCDPLKKLNPSATFDDYLVFILDNVNMYAKCADKQKTSVELLKQISNKK